MTSYNTIAKMITGGVAGGVAVSAVSALAATSTASIGAGIMSVSNPEYNTLQLIQMMAAGTVLLNGPIGIGLGAAMGLLEGVGRFDPSPNKVAVLGVVYEGISQIFSAMIGHGLFLEARQYHPSTEPLMTLEQTVTAAAVGAPFTYIIFLLLIGFSMACCCPVGFHLSEPTSSTPGKTHSEFTTSV